MKNYFILILLLAAFQNVQSQKTDKKQLIKELANDACSCIDSIPTYNRIKDSITANIHSCIDYRVVAYQITDQLSNIDLSDNSQEKKEIKVPINTDKNPKEYQDIYYDLERYLMENCEAIKSKVASTDKENKNSVSNNKEAMKYYELGIEESKKNNFKEAIENYKKAVKIDPNFAFAYDNMGICYRKLEQYDEAIDAYEKSLKIDPQGLLPLQNIAVAYSYKKEYKKAIKTYEKLALIEPNNPEVFYGIGQMYSMYIKDYEKGLDNMCKAYSLYVAQKSPYRTDAEKIIQMLYDQMKKDGNEKKFNEILEANNISQN
ncbi:tetratricopeptide repeat protein [Flavobacterium sp. Root186]|uniref:tetratricopeptide repeat protein n=1 Tax=Flavobacterium sp. Root186 TaxID=1736485 RepID=UPI0006FBBB98|nr:tetratricopeptide repeat protein [Flavobacterium sp. Root186]KRB59157.1 hypothetical protein ASD98_23095 [Flavobacterium sp. Root186]